MVKTRHSTLFQRKLSSLNTDEKGFFLTFRLIKVADKVIETMTT